MSKIKVLVTVPVPLRGLILSDEALARLNAVADVQLNEDGRNWTSEELAQRLPGVDAMITSWGIVKLDEQVLAKADRLKLVAHAAGSVKGFVTDALYDRGIRVTHAAARIAESVAEYSLLTAMMGLRRPQDYDRRMKAGEAWPKAKDDPIYEIRGKKVGLLGMGYVGRCSARAFQAVGAEVLAYDPYLSQERAHELGVCKAELDELLSTCKVVSVHLPVTEETHNLLGTRELALLQDGAVFVNTARSWVVDQDALLRELSTGRFWAALDVFGEEPLSLESPWRQLDNVLLSPHIAGLSIDSYRGLVALAVKEIERWQADLPLQYEVTHDMLATMA